MPRQHSDSQEFSRFVEADSVGHHRMERRIAANPEERTALARRFGLVSLDRLEASFSLRRAGSGVIHVTGTLEADVVQSCVVTLEPVPAKIAESFAADFAADSGGMADPDLDFEEADPPEPIRNGHIDLGELAAGQLALALDPYPRAPGAAIPPEYSPGAEPEPAAVPTVNPFSILKK
ncbi:MAG TPA: YceD family protein [Candidatus Cybelea sp.]|nr:YceD family protein [Candidatus Cybelea sp.]